MWLKLKCPRDRFSEWDESEFISNCYQFAFFIQSVSTWREMQEVSEGLRKTVQIFKALFSAVRTARERSGPNFPLVPSVRDKTSQQQLWKLRSSWEERRKKKKETDKKTKWRRAIQTMHRGTLVFSFPQKMFAALINFYFFINAVPFVWILHCMVHFCPLSAFTSIPTLFLFSYTISI